MVRDGKLERFDKYGKDIPKALDAIVRKALAKGLDERFQSAADFRDALKELEFRFGLRVGPPDLGQLAADLFDKNPEALARLKERLRKWEIKLDDAPARKRSASPPPIPSQPPGREDSQSIRIDVEEEPGSGPSLAATDMAAALDDALSNAVSLVQLDQYATPVPTPAPGWSPSSVDHITGGLGTPSALDDIPATSSHRAATTGARRMMVPPASGPSPSPASADQNGEPVPDNTGDISLISTMRVIADLAITADTGLVRFANESVVKDVYLVRGAPESVNSNLSGDRFGEYLVTRGFLRLSDLERALAEMGRFSGKLGEALVGLGFMRPLDVFRLLSQQVRERVMELFTWTEGQFSFFRGLQNPVAAFPLGLNSFEILGAGVLTLSYDFLASHFLPMSEFHPRALPNPRINPEAFRLGPTPREVWNMLDGSQTLGEWCQRFGSPDEILTFYRTLHLLVETSLVQFE